MWRKIGLDEQKLQLSFGGNLVLFVTAWNYFRKERKINVAGDFREQVAIENNF